jgi:hypothetical protein
MMVDREVAGEEEAAESALPMQGVTRTTGLMMIHGAAIALMVRVSLITMGGIPRIDLSQHHVPPGVTPMTW